jgi:hypothetical protein
LAAAFAKQRNGDFFVVMANAGGVRLQQVGSPLGPPSTLRVGNMRVKTIVFKLIELRGCSEVAGANRPPVRESVERRTIRNRELGSARL